MKDYEWEESFRAMLRFPESDEQYSGVDTLRITWPSGLTYSEVVADCTQIDNDCIYICLVGGVKWFALLY